MAALRRQAGESERLVRFFLDASPHPQAIFSKSGLEYVNRRLLMFMGFVSFHEFQASGLELGEFLRDGETPLADPVRFAREILDDPLDREQSWPSGIRAIRNGPPTCSRSRPRDCRIRNGSCSP